MGKTKITAKRKTVKSRKQAEPKIPSPLPKAPRSFRQGDIKKIYESFKMKRTSTHLYQGRLCFFFNMSKHGNKITDEGFICGIGANYQLVPKNVKQPLIASIFAREKAGQQFIYIGDINNIIRFNNSHNKMLWG
jgi:hypothetical protein